MQNNSEAAAVAQSTAPPESILWIGLDWADQKHALSVLTPGGRKAQRHQVEHKPAALDEFFLKLRQQHPQSVLAVCIEQARGPVIYALMKHAFLRIYPINPRSLADFRRALGVSGAKSDERDSDLLCEFAAKHHPRLRPLMPEDMLTRRLRLEVEARRSFVEERTAGVNQLIAALKCFYPLVLELFGEDLGGPMALEFLRRWPSLTKLKKASESALRAFFHTHNSRSEERIQARLKAIAAAAALTEDEAIVPVFECKARCLARQIAAAQKSIQEFDKRIEETFRQHPEASLFDLPGAGRVMAPRLVAIFGTQRENWGSAEDLQCRTGVAPVRKQSGQMELVFFRRARPKFAHQTMVEFAKCSIQFCAWARLLYDDQLKKGKSKFAAIRTLAFKWLRILYHCWKERVAYDEAKYLASLQAKGVKLYESLYLKAVA